MTRQPNPAASASAPELRAELETLTAEFAAVSDERDRLTPEGFQAALGLRSAFVAQHLFRQFDLDGNGFIERSEFIRALESLLRGTPEDKLAFLFRVHDQDEDGDIDRLELDRLIHLGLAESSASLPDELVDEMVDALFEASDHNGDGRICLSEFSAVFAGYPELLSRVTAADSVWRSMHEREPPAPAPTHTPLRRAAIWLEEHGAEALILLVYGLINLALFVHAVLHYHALGASPFVQLARGCGACLNFNCALVFVPMLRHTLTWLRAGPLGRVLPLDHSVSFHRLIGQVIMAFALIHTIAHLCNYALVDAPLLDGLLGTRPGWTGLVLMISTGLIWGFALERVRGRGNFQLFHAVHLLYWPFFVLLLVHGPVYWMWAAAPLLAYLAERVIRWRRAADEVELSTTPLPSAVTKLAFRAPEGWRHSAGDYLFIRIPEVARYEWHPFTISSAPERVGAGEARGREELTLHVRSLGNWTRALNELAQSRARVDYPRPLPARIDGPYGTPTAHIFKTRHAVLIGAGIGVTPFAAILDSILRRKRAGDDSAKLEKVHFVWVNRDQHAFEWFAELLGELEREDRDRLLDIHIYMTGGREQLDAAALQLAREVFYAKTNRDVFTGLAARTNFGRPDWEPLLTQILRSHAPAHVEVFMCGPKALIKVLQPLCRELGMGFHYEVF